MRPQHFTARGLALAALVLCISACSETPPEPAAPRSLKAAEHATRVGDVQALLAHTGKDEGFQARAKALADRFDPPAWLIAVGGGGFEHSLPDIHNALHRGGRDELLAALGMTPQALRANILAGGGSIHTRRAAGMVYYDVGPQPLDLLRGIDPPGLPDGCIAADITLWGRLEGRNLRVRYGLDESGVTALHAGIEQARDSVALPPDARRTELPELADERFYGAEIRTLWADGMIGYMLVGRDADGWAVAELTVRSMAARLDSTRDERLEAIRRRATDFARSSGRWPRGLHELSLTPRELVDPSRPGNAWGDFAPGGPEFELAPADALWAAAALYGGFEGRRAITRAGEYIWVD